jgi:hypothetical protein
VVERYIMVGWSWSLQKSLESQHAMAFGDSCGTELPLHCSHKNSVTFIQLLFHSANAISSSSFNQHLTYT